MGEMIAEFEREKKREQARKMNSHNEKRKKCGTYRPNNWRIVAKSRVAE